MADLEKGNTSESSDEESSHSRPSINRNKSNSVNKIKQQMDEMANEGMSNSTDNDNMHREDSQAEEIKQSVLKTDDLDRFGEEYDSFDDKVSRKFENYSSANSSSHPKQSQNSKKEGLNNSNNQDTVHSPNMNVKAYSKNVSDEESEEDSSRKEESGSSSMLEPKNVSGVRFSKETKKETKGLHADNPYMLSKPGDQEHSVNDGVASINEAKSRDPNLEYGSDSDEANSQEPDDLIKLVNVHKTYLLGLEGVQALRGINLTVKKGEFVTILGTSGGGKTTLLNIIGTIDKPTKGDLYLSVGGSKR